MSDYKKFSFLDDFEMPEITHDTIRQQLVKLGRTHTIKQRKTAADMPLEDRLDYITKEVTKVLGRYVGFIHVIKTKDELNEYFELANKAGYLAFDTETNNSLDPLTCKLMGVCCYIPNTKPVYIPVNHCKPGTNVLLENQVSSEYIQEFFIKLKNSNIKMIYHNGKFDIRVCYNTMGVYLPIYWDTMIAAQVLNENELAKLKYQYKQHVDPTISTYDIENLFTGLPYAWVDPDIFALYAATDTFDTYKLYEYQKGLFEQDDLKKMYNLFMNVEMPVVTITAKMEDTGIRLDTEYLSKLHNKYTEKVDKYKAQLDEILKPYDEQIRYYQSLGKLDVPINYDSPQQLSILLYNILKIEPLEDFGKSTDKNVLKALNTPFTNAFLQYRHYGTLIKTFTKPLPEWLSPKDNRIHADINQMGAEENNVRTGRMSSRHPNLQQMPSKEQSLRMMFKASEYTDALNCDNDVLQLALGSEIETPDGWKYADMLNVGDSVYVYDETDTRIIRRVQDVKLGDLVKVYV